MKYYNFIKKREIKWKINDFNKWVREGKPINKNIIELDISYSNIDILENMENLVNLKILYCSDNELTTLEGIKKLINLKYLYCNTNNLTSLEGIENLINLKELYCHNNQLTSLEGIENLVNLEVLYSYHNKLTSLEGIGIFVKLIKNNKKIKRNLQCHFMDFDYIELNDLFNNLLACKNEDKINEYIEEIEQMIIELNGFEEYILK
jgi:Leucine-rich repeat (LRR) protein